MNKRKLGIKLTLTAILTLSLFQYMGYKDQQELKSEQAQEMYIAAENNQTEDLLTMLQLGWDANSICKDPCTGWTPLMIASAEGHTDVVKLLLSHNADPNIQNSFGRTALHFAERYEFYDIVEALLKAGANPNLESVDKDVNSPMKGALTQKNDSKMLKLLIQYGGNPNLVFWDLTPLIQAVMFNDAELVQMLIEKNADPYYVKIIKGKSYTAIDLASNKPKIKKLLDKYIKKYKKD